MDTTIKAFISILTTPFTPNISQQDEIPTSTVANAIYKVNEECRQILEDSVDTEARIQIIRCIREAEAEIRAQAQPREALGDDKKTIAFGLDSKWPVDDEGAEEYEAAWNRLKTARERADIAGTTRANLQALYERMEEIDVDGLTKALEYVKKHLDEVKKPLSVLAGLLKADSAAVARTIKKRKHDDASQDDVDTTYTGVQDFIRNHFESKRNKT